MGLCLCPISKSSISMEQSFPKWILCHGVSMTGVCAMAVIEPLWEPVYEGPNNEFDGEPLLVESFSTVTIAPSRKSHGYNAHPPPLPDVQSWDAKCVMSPISSPQHIKFRRHKKISWLGFFWGLQHHPCWRFWSWRSWDLPQNPKWRFWNLHQIHDRNDESHERFRDVD